MNPDRQQKDRLLPKLQVTAASGRVRLREKRVLLMLMAYFIDLFRRNCNLDLL
jgi:hypothetical protein